MALERVHGVYYDVIRHRVAVGCSDDGRCPICRCIPHTQHVHAVADPTACGYQYLTTCGSAYCRSKDGPA
jgi:hypothetical protein